jgi:hypothetical protein
MAPPDEAPEYDEDADLDELPTITAHGGDAATTIVDAPRAALIVENAEEGNALVSALGARGLRILFVPGMLALVDALVDAHGVEGLDAVVALRPRPSMRTAQELAWARGLYERGVVVVSNDASFDDVVGVQRRVAPASSIDDLVTQLAELLRAP